MNLPSKTPWIALVLALAAACVTAEEVSRVESPQHLREGDTHFRRKDYDQALASYLLAVKGAVEESDRPTQVSGLAQVALVYALQGDHERACRSVERAAEIADPKDVDAWSRYLLARGAVERATGERESALATYRELYDYASLNSSLERAVQAAHMATLIASGEDRVEWARRGIDTAETSGKSTWLASAWLALAWIYEDLGQHAEALGAFASAKNFAERTGSDDAALQADWALAHGFRMAGNRSRARDLAQRTLARAETAYVASGGTAGNGYPEFAFWVAQCQRELAELHVDEGDWEHALERFSEAYRYFLLAGLRERAPASLAVLEHRLEEVRGHVSSSRDAALSSN